MQTPRDVIVIGGGPAGAAAATLLASRGLDVLALERATFPRFHVGESLLPAALPVLDALGVDLSEGPWVRKAGAEFHDEAAGAAATFLFADGLPGTPDHAYQVERARFDELLLERARAAGVEAREGVAVREVTFADAQVTVAWEGGSAAARYVIDATGQRTLFARRERSLHPYRSFGRAAVFAHAHEVDPGVWSELVGPGHIKILSVDGGWAWAIPLHGRTLSVGVVLAEGRAEAARLMALVETSPLLRRLTAGARWGETHRVGDYSYANTRPIGARYVCLGDSAHFLDPVFSSGVTLALVGAQRAVPVIAAALGRGGEDDPALLGAWSNDMNRGFQTFGALIHRFYHSRLVANLFYGSHERGEIHRGIVSVLAGDVWRTDNPFQSMLLAPSRRNAWQLATVDT